VVSSFFIYYHASVASIDLFFFNSYPHVIKIHQKAFGKFMGCIYSLQNINKINNVTDGKHVNNIIKNHNLKSLPLSVEVFLSLPLELLSEILGFLPIATLANLESALGKQLDTDLAWQQLCFKEGLTSRTSFLSSGSIVITNRPSPLKLSWKKLYKLNYETQKPKKYLTYKDSKNRKYVVFVNEPTKSYSYDKRAR
tara:strand:+ start:95 stop:682 length:588 start_codon:yes stop_codon:yes gene_type:complete